MAMLENTTNMCSLDDSVFFDIIKLCRLLVAYYLTVPPGAAHSDQGETASIFTQILCKCCHLVSTLYQYAENVFLVTPGASAGAAAGASAIAVNVHTALEDATQLVQIVSEGIMFLNAQLSQSSAGGAVHASTTEGNLQFRAYYASMLFWQTCTELLHLLQRIEHTSCLASAKQVNATAGTSSGHTAAPHEARWRTLQCRIFNVFYATAPSAEQIQSELHRLQVYRLDSHLFSADQFCMKFLLPSYGVPKTTYREDINVVTVRSDLSAALAYGISSGQADASSPRQQQGQVHLPQTSFRMRFLFYGINTLFDAAVSLNSPTQMLLTATPAGVLVQAPASIASPGEISAKWAVALAEILFNILSEARAGNCGSLLYAPYFAQQILLILRKLPAPQSKGTNWIYWDLAKVL